MCNGVQTKVVKKDRRESKILLHHDVKRVQPTMDVEEGTTRMFRIIRFTALMLLIFRLI